GRGRRGMDPVNTMENLTQEVEAIRSMARAILGCSHAADDAVQDAWIAASGAGAELQHGGPRRAAWLRGVLRNVARRQLRVRRQEEDARALRSADLAGDLAAVERLTAPSVQDPVETAETAARLAAAVRDLPEAYQAVLVRRYWHREDFGSIAIALGTTKKVVLNRHFRALETLRERFDPRRGGADSLALLPLVPGALIPKALIPSGQKTAASALVPALTAMKASTSLTALVLASLALTAFVVQSRSEGPEILLDPGAEESGLELTAVAELPQSPGSTPTRLEVPLAPEEEARKPERSSVELPPPPMQKDASLKPAIVRWRAMDAETGEPVKSVEVKGATETRFVQRAVRKDDGLALTPGRWTLAIQAVPYEVREIGPLVLEEGQVVDLGEIELLSGTGSIIGAVDVPAAVAATGPFRVELYGKGRSRCGAECPVEATFTEKKNKKKSSRPCAHCGYAKDRSLLAAVAAGEHFRFDRLSAGFYRAVIFDAAGRLRFQTNAEVSQGETTRLDLRMEFQDVAFYIVDAENAPFDGKWEEEGTRYCAPLEFYFSADSGPCASAHTKARSANIFNPKTGEWSKREDYVYLRDPVRIQRLERSRVAISQALSQGAREGVSRSLDRELLERAFTQSREETSSPPPAREPEDHARAPEELPEFVSSAPKPEISTKSLKARQDGPGRYRVLQVPEQADKVTITCGPYFATISLNEPGPSGIFDVQLIERCNAQPELFIDTRNCVDCHPNTSVAQMQW
ncbi:MAG: sigma-70 family RNA polymerase sigma factor, partial [Planctomycetota bacterium]